MVFPANWPPALPSGRRVLRFYQAGTLTVNFSDNAWLFIDGKAFLPLPVVPPGSVAPVHVGRPADPSASPPEGLMPSAPSGGGVASPNVDGSAGPPPMAWCAGIQIQIEAGAYLEYTFDGVTVHGRITGGVTEFVRNEYRDRYEAGIAVRGTNLAAFILEAW